MALMDSDSDSDLDFLASNRPSLDKELQLKMGENAILRQRLESLEQESMGKIANLLKRQSEEEDKWKEQIRKYQKLYEQERSVHMMRVGDYNLSIGRKPSNADFSDGFNMVKQQSTETKKQSVVPFLLAHETVGFDEPSIQFLFGVPTASSSIGHELLQCQDINELIEKLISLLGVPPYTDDLNAIFLSILFDAQFLNIGLSKTCLQETPMKLCTLLSGCMEQLNELPTFDKLDALALVNLEQIRLHTYTLYLMDILLATNWEFDFPVYLASRIVDCSLYIPLVKTRGIDLFTKYPRSEFAKENYLNMFMGVEPKNNSICLLFGGLQDPAGFTAASLAKNAPKNSKFARLVPKLTLLPELQSKVELSGLKTYLYAQLRSISFAHSLLKVAEEQTVCDRHVLQLLQSNVDSYPFVNGDLQFREIIVENCLFYLWARQPRRLKESLTDLDKTDLKICLSKVRGHKLWVDELS